MQSGRVIGQTLDGKYKIEKELGRGGMGTVYLATHVGTGRPVAVKVIVPEYMQHSEFAERFRREARAAGKLRHPNVVNVTDFGFAEVSEGQVAYLVMEYLDGCTLGEILEEEKKIPLWWTIDILEQVCSAVQEAHQRGIIHRDLKPDNIWLEPNQRGGYTVKVLDFGIAKLEEEMACGAQNANLPSSPAGVPTKNSQRATVADLPQSGTAVKNQYSSTVISEAATIAQTGEGATIAQTGDGNDLKTEAATIIQEEEIDSGGGTAILPTNQNKTALLNKGAGTKLISEPEDTGKPLQKRPTTKDLTRVGAVLGTPLYMSPEQCRGERLSTNSDIYSLGVIAYQMLSGNTPFTGDFRTVMQAHREIQPPALEAKRVPKRLKKTIMSALAKDPAERPQSAEAFASKLRANAEGSGELFRRALVIYSEHLPKFLLLSFVTALPLLLFTVVKVIYTILELGEIVRRDAIAIAISSVLGLTTFFLQIFYAAFLVGMTTWIVAQVLAFPLRPISLRAAFREAKKRWKPLLGTVTISTLLAIVGLFFCLLPGIWMTARYMLIAPSIMMENVRGRAAFRRSIELVKRSYGTVFATAFLVYFVPSLVAIIMAISIGGIVNSVKMEINEGKEKPAAESQVKEESSNAKEESSSIVVKSSGGGIKIGNKDNTNADKEAEESIAPAISQQIFEILWLPFAIIISSFTSVVTALLYFKTRQAGGETMQDLLGKFEEDDKPVSNWQMRVRERLQQSGKLTSKS